MHSNSCARFYHLHRHIYGLSLGAKQIVPIMTLLQRINTEVSVTNNTRIGDGSLSFLFEI